VTAFESYNFAPNTELAGKPPPTDVVRICQLTSVCETGFPFPNVHGYQVIAAAFAPGL